MMNQRAAQACVMDRGSLMWVGRESLCRSLPACTLPLQSGKLNMKLYMAAFISQHASCLMQLCVREGSPIQSLMMLKMLMVGSFCFGFGKEVLCCLGTSSEDAFLSHSGTSPAASSRGVIASCCCSKVAPKSAGADIGAEEVGWVRGEEAVLSWPAAAEAVCSSTDWRGVGTARLRWLADLHALGPLRSTTMRCTETIAVFKRRQQAGVL